MNIIVAEWESDDCNAVDDLAKKKSRFPVKKTVDVNKTTCQCLVNSGSSVILILLALANYLNKQTSSKYVLNLGDKDNYELRSYSGKKCQHTCKTTTNIETGPFVI